MTTADFHVHKWGKYFIVNAQTPRAVEWFRTNWKTKFDPPNSRATKVDRLVGEIVWWVTNYYNFTVSFGKDMSLDLTSLPRILDCNRSEAKGVDDD